LPATAPDHVCAAVSGRHCLRTSVTRASRNGPLRIADKEARAATNDDARQKTNTYAQAADTEDLRMASITCHHLSKDTFLSPLQNLIDGGLRSSMSFVPFRGGAQALID